MIISLSILVLIDFFGYHTIDFLLNKVYKLGIKIIPPVIFIFLFNLFLKLEEGVQEYIAVLVFLVLSLGLGYYNFTKSIGDNQDAIRKIEKEIQTLKTNQKIPMDSSFYGRELLKNSIYLKSGIVVQSDISSMKPNDYLILENLSPSARTYLDRKNIPISNILPYHIIDATTLLISKSLIDRILSDTESELGRAISSLVNSYKPHELSLYEKWNHLTGKLFGL